MNEIIFATGNKGRFVALQHELELAGLQHVDVAQRKLDLIEIQSMDLAQISLFKARQAYEQLQAPVLVMDGGFYMDGLNGFPAAYTHDMVETVGIEKIARIASVLDEKACRFNSVATYIEGPDNYQQFFDTTGDVFTLTHELWPTDHPKQWSPLWRVIVPTGFGYTKPLAGLNEEEMAEFLKERRIFSGSPALKQFVDFLQAQEKQAA